MSFLAHPHTGVGTCPVAGPFPGEGEDMIKDLIEEHRAAIEAHAEACASFRGLLSLGHRPVVYEEERPSGWGWGVDVIVRVIWSGPLGAAYAEKKRAWIRRRRALDALQQAEAAKAISRGRTPGIR